MCSDQHVGILRSKLSVLLLSVFLSLPSSPLSPSPSPPLPPVGWLFYGFTGLHSRWPSIRVRYTCTWHLLLLKWVVCFFLSSEFIAHSLDTWYSSLADWYPMLRYRSGPSKEVSFRHLFVMWRMVYYWQRWIFCACKSTVWWALLMSIRQQ